MRSFKQYINRKQRKYGEEFDDSDLSKQFVEYYENERRIEVDFGNGEIKRGRIGISTGWKPIFLLMLKSNSTGSCYTLTDKCKILRIMD